MKTPNVMGDFLKEITDLLKTFDKIGTSYYYSKRGENIEETDTNRNDNEISDLMPVNLEEKLMESCRQLSECVRRSELASEM